MKLILLLSIFFSITFSAAVAQQRSSSLVAAAESGEWVNVAPANAKFTILMPGKASGQSQPLGSFPGLEHHMLTLETPLAGYVVSYVEYAEAVTDPAAIKEMLDNGREGGLTSGKAELKSEKEMKIDGYFGREWVITLPGNLKSTARAYWVSNRLYQIIFVESVGAIETPELRKLRDEAKARFLNSFTLNGDAVK